MSSLHDLELHVSIVFLNDKYNFLKIFKLCWIVIMLCADFLATFSLYSISSAGFLHSLFSFPFLKALLRISAKLFATTLAFCRLLFPAQ